jgi:hypothetical protein
MSEIGVSNENHISACSRRAAKHPIGDYDENSASYNDCGVSGANSWADGLGRD